MYITVYLPGKGGGGISCLSELSPVCSVVVYLVNGEPLKENKYKHYIQEFSPHCILNIDTTMNHH